MIANQKIRCRPCHAFRSRNLFYSRFCLFSTGEDVPLLSTSQLDRNPFCVRWRVDPPCQRNGFQAILHDGSLGPAVCYGPPGKNAKVQEENPRRTRGKSSIFIVFSMIFWSKPIPKPPDNPSDHFEPVSASPDHSQPILQQICKLRQKCKTKSKKNAKTIVVNR